MDIRGNKLHIGPKSGVGGGLGSLKGKITAKNGQAEAAPQNHNYLKGINFKNVHLE